MRDEPVASERKGMYLAGGFLVFLFFFLKRMFEVNMVSLFIL